MLKRVIQRMTKPMLTPAIAQKLASISLLDAMSVRKEMLKRGFGDRLYK